MLMEVKVGGIIVEERARKALGWLDSLERSIQQVGVLQPIGITPDKKLIFGGRRLQACKNLGIETIPARVFDIDANDPVAALKMERDENEQRVDLTPSEKVELGRRIEESLAGRQGSNQYQQKELPQIFGEAETPKQKESASIAANAIGMNRETYRQAKAIVESGDREAVRQMDEGKAVSAVYGSIRKPARARTFKVTLYRNPEDDAEVLLSKGGSDYCTKLALAILKAAGHKVEPH